ncbi:hypothetical protein BJV78DRAFT_467472 [Lactifluus subvellereus]|nr:hypothetical protein BJV78DRAFT_467472 [Lactifluus subvellereus]
MRPRAVRIDEEDEVVLCGVGSKQVTQMLSLYFSISSICTSTVQDCTNEDYISSCCTVTSSLSATVTSSRSVLASLLVISHASIHRIYPHLTRTALAASNEAQNNLLDYQTRNASLRRSTRSSSAIWRSSRKKARRWLRRTSVRRPRLPTLHATWLIVPSASARYSFLPPVNAN